LEVRIMKGKKIPVSKDIYQCLNEKGDCGETFRPTIEIFRGKAPYCICCGSSKVKKVGRATGKRPVLQVEIWEGGESEPLGISITQPQGTCGKVGTHAG
jgi:hypothetical protein